MSVNAGYFEQLFASSDDPWQFRTRWYERRKRDLIMACLPRQHYETVFEPACANGELSAALAPRCEKLLCQDGDPTAVRLARERLVDAPQVQVEQGWLPADWPDGTFDLIVLGEIGYYLSAADWCQVIARARDCLTPAGAVLACHWLAPIDGCALDGRQVHALLEQHLPLPCVLRHEEAQFVLELWSRESLTFDLQETCR
ncbi:class I SAM-dependent methyltransferase [Pseudomonas vanderleydeniana]|uniref:Nodulation S family protein n=1 Tax=Pseudomonas vanderleydeniana TaxID=2745495 RepID=A0A9E6PH34_9PSED|nr:class I SAM-dependent methyltransferase [Pseudomonas vanderleydeniana]QXI26312.1 nodulation S family protein [Pseudomonas vanderleydeniana]